jgi:hypothetical protein
MAAPPGVTPALLYQYGSRPQPTNAVWLYSNATDFSLYDSILVATALISDAKILYSEDLQHG